MYEYTIKKNADVNAFYEVCSLILSKVEEAEKSDYLEDVDGTQILKINTPGGEIKVYNDYEVDAVYVDSAIKLDKVL